MRVLEPWTIVFAVVSAYPMDLPAAEQPAVPAVNGKPRNVILMIGDGMGLVQLSAAKIQKGQLAVERMKHCGFTFTQSLRNFVTDSSAAATALATGYLTANGQVCIATDGAKLKTVLEYAKSEGKWAGIVVTCGVTHATPACMFAHVLSRASEDEIAVQMAQSNIEVIFGGGWDKFLPARRLHVGAPSSPGDQVLVSTSSMRRPGDGMMLAASPDPLHLGSDGKPFGTRRDGRDLLAEMQKQGYRVIRTPAELSMVSEGPPTKVLGLFHSGPMPKATEGRSPALSAMTLTALRILSQNPRGFFMMIEGSQIDWGGHANDFAYTVAETADFDTAVETVLDFVEHEGIAEETLVVVTADHETGGLSLTPSATLPMGIEPKWSTSGHTGCPVPIFSSGPDHDLFSGILSHEAVGRNLIQAVSSKPVQFHYAPDKSLPVTSGVAGSR